MDEGPEGFTEPLMKTFAGPQFATFEPALMLRKPETIIDSLDVAGQP